MNNPMNPQHSLVKDTFTMDFTDNVFTGYHNGGKWNGWAMPAFEYEEAVKIVEMFEGNEDMVAVYSPHTDSFVFMDLGFEEEIADHYEGFEIEVDGQVKKLYDIGSGYWTWQIAKVGEGE